MPSLKQLEERARELSAKRLAVVNDDSRPWSERHTEFKSIGDDLSAVLEQHAAIKGVDDLDAIFDGGRNAQGVGGAPDRESTKSIGQQVVDSEAFGRVRAMKSAGGGGTFTTGGIAVKDLTVSGPTNPGVLAPQQLPGLVDIQFRRLTIRDLLAPGTMDSAAVTYAVETTATNAADAVAMGALKPESALVLSSTMEAAKKIATVLKEPDEILDDVSFARSYIDARLRLFVQLKEEDELLNGSGTGAHLTGLLNRSGKATAITRTTGEPVVDAIFRQITAIQTSAFLDPEGIVINPIDWQSIRLSKDANQQYYGGGPFAPAAGPTLWGLPVVATPAIAQGTVLVGAFRAGAQVLQRTGLSVEVTNTDQDDFVKNRVTFRAEERLALAVYRPGAFGTVSTAAAA